MSRTFKDSRGKSSKEPRRITARGVKRRPIDYRKLSRALLELAEVSSAQAEKDAEKDATNQATITQKPPEQTNVPGSGPSPEEAA
ncbi:MAG: hypothetical protein V9G19_04410 [Tetrasphaera sp.]